MNEGSGSTILVIVLVLAGLGVAIAIYFGVKRHKYVTALRERGWQFESNPSSAIANGLLVPPFGVGFQRDTDEHVSGRTRSGVDFQVFEYQAAGDARVVCMPLGLPLPELVAVSTGQVRMGVTLPERSMLPSGGLLLSQDRAFADAFMAVAGSAIAGFAAAHQLSLAVDGDQLTQVGAPKDPDELEAYLEALVPIVTAVQAGRAQLEGFRTAAPPMRLGFYHRPSWYYLATDDGVLDVVEHTRGGNNHRTTDVVHGEMYPGCFFVAFVHHWQTQRIESYTDANGNTQTRTVTDNHSETIHEVTLPFRLPNLTVTNDSRMRRLFSGPSLDFELAAFNKAYDVYCEVPKFAYDVLHPRQIEYLMSVGTMPFSITDGRIRPRAGQHSPEAIAFELDVLAGFLARIPAFVWQDLGLAQPPLRLNDRGMIEVRTG